MPDSGELLPLRPMQRELLMQAEAAGPRSQSLAIVFYAITGDLDVAAFRQTWQAIVDRHGSLRSAFTGSAFGDPRRVVRPSRPISFEIEDWRGVGPDDYARALDRVMAAEVAMGFDLGETPLNRFRLMRLAEARWFFAYVSDHIVIDLASVGQLFRDLAELYPKVQRGQLPAAAPEAVSVAPVSPDRSARFWRCHLAGIDGPPRLAIDRAPAAPPPAPRAYRSHTLTLTAAESAALSALRDRHGVRLKTVFQAALAILLGRYARRTDLVIGLMIPGRPPGSESVVDLLTNVLPARHRIDPGARLIDWLHRLQDDLRDLAALGNVPAADIRRWSGIASDRPLFDVELLFNKPEPPLVVGDPPAQFQIAYHYGEPSRVFPLSLMVTFDSEIELLARYWPARFTDDSIGRLLDQLRVLLRQLPTGLAQPVAALSLADAAEQQRILTAVHAPQAGPAPSALAAIARQMRDRPEAVAIRFEDATVSYRALDHRARAIGAALGDRGIGPGAAVGVYLERGPEVVCALLAIARLGAVYVPLDANTPGERVAFVLQDTAAAAVLSDSRLSATLPPGTTQPLDVAAIGPAASRPATDPPAPDHLAYILYTSGSTGGPKGVEVAWAGVDAVTAAAVSLFKLEPGDRMLQNAAIGFDVSVAEILMTLSAGAELVMAPQSALTPGDYLADLLATKQVTVAVLTPSALAATPRVDLPSLRVLGVTGEACPAGLTAPWSAGRRVLNLYGPTEATVWATAHDCTGERGAPPIGRALGPARTYVLDPALTPVPPGVPGELFIGGVGVARGYRNRPDLTRERFIADPFTDDPAARLYRSGDIVRQDADGTISYLGRDDDQLQLKGIRIEPAEIEGALSEIPGIAQAVVSVDDSGAEPRLIAHLVMRDAAQADASALKPRLRRTLPLYMIPAEFRPVADPPLTPSGKLDRAAIARIPAPRRPSPKTARAAHQLTPTERDLAALWREILAREEIAPGDDFFDLGGTSLDALRLLETVRRRRGVSVPLDAFWHHGATLASLAALVDSAEVADLSTRPLRFREASGRKPVFLAHTAGGNLFQYRALAAALDADLDVLGLPSEPMAGPDPADYSIERMAAHAIAVMQTAQADGPYALIGQCSGGVLAFEMARQLHAAGEAVRHLLIIDALAPPYPPIGNLRAYLDHGERAALRLLQERIYYLALRTTGQARRRRLRHLGEAQRWALWDYRPTPYDGAATVIRPAEFEYSAAPDLGWRRWATALRVVEVPGRHNAILNAAHVRPLAARLNEILGAGDAA